MDGVEEQLAQQLAEQAVAQQEANAAALRLSAAEGEMQGLRDELAKAHAAIEKLSGMLLKIQGKDGIKVELPFIGFDGRVGDGSLGAQRTLYEIPVNIIWNGALRIKPFFSSEEEEEAE